MIICPNCNHQNPEGSVQCESCYTPLPTTSPCPNCGARVQTDATFCGQCGYNLQGSEISMSPQVSKPFTDPFAENTNHDSGEEDLIPDTISVESFQSPWDVEEDEVEEADYSTLNEDELLFSLDDPEMAQSSRSSFEITNANEELEELPDDVEETEDLESWISSIAEESSQENQENLDLVFPELSESESSNLEELPPLEEELAIPVAESNLEELPSLEEELAIPVAESNLEELSSLEEKSTVSSESLNQKQELETTNQAVILEPKSLETPTLTNAFLDRSDVNVDTSTRLQLQRAILFHLQTGTNLEIPLNLAIVRIGKPNNQVPPDIDVSGFPNSEIVSRIHADIRVEGDTYFIEDRGSSNGTYVNHSPLLTGNRHRLRAGDRISLGKGDLMTFIFQLD